MNDLTIPFFEFTNGHNSTTILGLLFKNFFLIGAIFYLIFAVVVIRQIAVMKKTLITSFSPVIQSLGYLHLALAVGLMLFYLSVL